MDKIALLMKALPWRKKVVLRQIAEIDVKIAEAEKEIKRLKKEIAEAKRAEQEGEEWKK